MYSCDSLILKCYYYSLDFYFYTAVGTFLFPLVCAYSNIIRKSLSKNHLITIPTLQQEVWMLIVLIEYLMLYKCDNQRAVAKNS